MATTVDQTMKLDASPEKVFKALTDAREMVNWFPSVVKNDPQTGGKLRYEWKFQESEKDGFQDGEYLEVVDGKKVSHTWDADGQATTVTFTLAPANGGTELHLVHSGWGDGMEEAAEMHGGIWGGYLQNLKGYLEQGQDMRAEMMGQITE